MKKRIAIVSFSILILCVIILMVNVYREKTINSIIGKTVTDVTKIEIIKYETITDTITDKQTMEDIIKNICKIKIKRPLEQPSLIPYSDYTYIQFYNNDKVIVIMTLDNGRGYI
ncbi:hypothetical protein G9F72_004460 [Clostridium estertheticum]|uniref:hypothetical protein n=1 Tax=Clostridium estertheticum TaxID=238834 RepID=UPI0013E99AD2|nr:hypothetical protein [Clostridium estertheticum]MBZ9685604.1 hypothetical protein [Clostridium estertheticum]